MLTDYLTPDEIGLISHYRMAKCKLLHLENCTAPITASAEEHELLTQLFILRSLAGLEKDLAAT